MNKQLFCVVLLVAILFMVGMMVGEALVYKLQAPARCVCLNHQPYIHTKWTGSECLTLVWDTMDYFDGKSMVKYLYSSMQYCK